MSTFQPPPTWASPVIVDETTGRSIFNPIWLKWFIDLAAGLTASGAGSGNASGYTPVVTDHFVKWLDTSATALGDGGVIGSAAHADVTDFLAAGSAISVPTVKVTNAGGFKSSDNSSGFTGTVTTASLIGKTITIKDGIITGFA